MGKKTIKQALKDLFLGLGGDPSALGDNTSVSDYIEDLEGAIGGAAESLIDDSSASETTTYSSSKIEELAGESAIMIKLTGSGSSLTLDTDLSIADIIGLIQAGKNVVFYEKGSNSARGWSIDQAIIMDVLGTLSYTLALYRFTVTTNDVTVENIKYTTSKTSTVTEKNLSIVT